MISNLKANNLLKLRNRHFVITDVCFCILAAFLSYAIRFDTFSPNMQLENGRGILVFIAAAVPIKLVVFYLFGLYRRYWRAAGPGELLLVVFSCMTASLLILIVVVVLTHIISYEILPLPTSIPIIDALVSTVFITGSRFSLRAYTHTRRSQTYRQRATSQSNRAALIIGAGHTGQQVFSALSRETSDISPIGFLDDDSNKVGTVVRGLQVLGTVADLETIVRSFDVKLVIISVPTAPGKTIRQIALTCQKIGVEHQIMPSMYELVTGKINVNTLRRVSIDDLLRRRPIKLSLTDIQRTLRDRCVMITGAGGSIGSELVRQIAQHGPSRLLLVGHGENSLFAIEQKLKQEFPHVLREVLLADVQDLTKLETIFARWRPSFVFHAAAHKHVPMLESNVQAAVNNNICGTLNLVQLCNRFNVERMVLISSDKAVQPTNIMGRTKRIAEMIIMASNQEHPGRFTAVRFGNVLGSRGSVVPIFQEQIAAGGPITITSDKMTRYFMSIPESVLLVLKASVLTSYGPLFVLNMGDPVPILQLAEDMIHLSGLQPYEDIEIVTTGLRSGEKLFEELFWDYEQYQSIEHDTIFALRLTNEQLSHIQSVVSETLPQLLHATTHDELETRRLLEAMVMSMSRFQTDELLDVHRNITGSEKKGPISKPYSFTGLAG